MNVVAMIGRLVRDPERRSMPNGNSVAEFTIAVNKVYGKKDGEPDAYFFRVKAWGKTADFVSDYLTKGRLASVHGRLEQRSYTDNAGNKRDAWEIVADNVQGLDRPTDQKPAEKELTGAELKAAAQAEWDPFADE